jgi:hypothetical protein
MFKGFGLLWLLGGLSGCVTSLQAVPDEGIGYRQARFEQVQQIRTYRACRDHGFELDIQARKAGSSARYLAAARVLEGCETDLGSGAAELAVEERMRAFALAVQSHLKGGDIQGAQAALDRFETGFKGRDLYFDDGTSFVDTMQALLVAGGHAGRPAPTTANVPGEVQDELRRIAEWRR